MPNWCENIVELTNTHEEIAKLGAYLAENAGDMKFCDYWLPTPKELMDNEGWYDWRIKHWGIKWDVEIFDPVVERINDTQSTISVAFQSAWNHPLELYEYLTEKTPFIVKAMYNECGVGFCGEFKEGVDCVYEYGDTDIPEELKLEFGLEELSEDF